MTWKEQIGQLNATGDKSPRPGRLQDTEQEEQISFLDFLCEETSNCSERFIGDLQAPQVENDA
jgi:hypothetical protein